MSKKQALEVIELRDIMGMASGRGVMCRLLEELGYWNDTFNADPLMHAKLNGARGIALNIVQTMEEHMPESWITLQRERIERLYNRQQRGSTDDDDYND